MGTYTPASSDAAMNGVLPYFRWPCGMFDLPGVAEYSVIKYRPMPCTPAGDVVKSGLTKAQADEIVSKLNSGLPLKDVE